MIPLPGRMDSRDDIAVIVSNALNPLALQGTKFTSLANLVAAAQPQIGSKVRSFPRAPYDPHHLMSAQAATVGRLNLLCQHTHVRSLVESLQSRLTSCSCAGREVPFLFVCLSMHRSAVDGLT